ncbi:MULTISPECIES: hypothetical protein [Microbacterium]|uniref:hypothetical protein n=1 Tax=Microbacterium TaxID=33882 RepID=UPI0012FE62AC|nr:MULTISPECIES: hypothetical protein [Microbacterium]MDO8384326.1 hypothetical protein [Microbacterium sp.]
MLKKNIVVLGIALGIMALGAPAAASAVDDPYVRPAAVSIDDAAISQCETSTISFGARYWVSGETVAVTAAGARVAGASFTPSVTAGADGSLTATFQPPADGEGVYDITFTSATQSYTAPITVTPVANCEADPQVDQALALTGGGTSPWIYGIGGGLLVAGSALITVTVLRRRQA